MRTLDLIMIPSLALALAAPATGRADPALALPLEPASEAAPACRLSVDNPNEQALVIELDGVLVGFARPLARTELSTAGHGPATLRARLVQDDLPLTLLVHRQRLELAPGGVVMVALPVARRALVAVENRWSEDVSLEVDGADLRRLAAGEEAVFSAAVGSRFKLRTARGEVALSRLVEVDGLGWQEHALPPPASAAVGVHDAGPSPLDLFDAEHRTLQGFLPPATTTTLDRAAGERRSLVAWGQALALDGLGAFAAALNGADPGAG